MVSSISNNSTEIQKLMAQMMQSMKKADTDGTSGLSKNELASVDSSGDVGGSAFLKSLSDQFDSLDADGNGQLSASEIASAKPTQEPMGPPPGLSIDSDKKTSTSDSSSSTTEATGTTSSSSIEDLIAKMIEELMDKINNSISQSSSNSDDSKTSSTSSSKTDTSTDSSNKAVDSATGVTKSDLASIDTKNDSMKSNFVNNLISKFDSFDSDGDGKLSLQELQDATKKSSQELSTQASNSNGLSKALNGVLGSSPNSFLQKLLSNYQSGNLSGLTSALSIAG